MVEDSPNDFFSSSDKMEDLLPAFMKARTKREKSFSLVAGEKWMLATPAEFSIWAKLRSAAAVSRGIPSSRSWVPETPSKTPVFLSGGWAAHSSFQAALNCSEVRVWSHPYKRAYFSRILRLRAKERAARERAFSIVPGGEATVTTCLKTVHRVWAPKERYTILRKYRVAMHLGVCTVLALKTPGGNEIKQNSLLPDS